MGSRHIPVAWRPGPGQPAPVHRRPVAAWQEESRYRLPPPGSPYSARRLLPAVVARAASTSCTAEGALAHAGAATHVAAPPASAYSWRREHRSEPSIYRYISALAYARRRPPLRDGPLS